MPEAKSAWIWVSAACVIVKPSLSATSIYFVKSRTGSIIIASPVR